MDADGPLMISESATESWLPLSPTSALLWAFGLSGGVAFILSTANTVTGGGLGLLTPWLWVFTCVWGLQMLHLHLRGPVGEVGATAHLVVAAVALTADAVLQPIGFWQWMTAAVLVAVAVAGAALLSRVGAAVVCAATCIGLVVTTVRSYDDVLLQAALALPLLVSAMVPAGITFVLTQRLGHMWRQAQAAATTDPLTGLANRAGLSVQARTVVALAVEHDERVSVALLDVDHFKRINDAHGHAVGDAVLKAVAGALRAAVRSNDALARTGGEELLVVSRVSTTRDVEAAAERLRAAIENLDVDGLPRATTSVGTATATRAAVRRAFAAGERGAQDLLEQLSGLADDAMYVAKRSGRNRVQHSSLRYGAVDPTTPPLRINTLR